MFLWAVHLCMSSCRRTRVTHTVRCSSRCRFSAHGTRVYFNDQTRGGRETLSVVHITVACKLHGEERSNLELLVRTQCGQRLHDVELLWCADNKRRHESSVPLLPNASNVFEHRTSPKSPADCDPTAAKGSVNRPPMSTLGELPWPRALSFVQKTALAMCAASFSTLSR